MNPTDILKAMRIRIEVSSLATPYQSGVSSYVKLLTNAFAEDSGSRVYGHYFIFLNRQPQPLLDSEVILEEDKLLPLRLYAKLQSYGLAPAFDTLLPKVDLTIFPNFATWPTVKSKLRATTIHDLTYLYYPETVEAKNLPHLRRVVPRSIKTADFILTVSESVKKELVKEFQIDPDKIVATPLPPEEMFAKTCSAGELKKVREKYKIGSKRYIFFLGNFEPRKNLKTLIAAYRTLPDSIKNNYQLVLAGGKGWKSDEAKAALDDAINAGESVVHIGYIDDVDRPALYQAASLYVMPSLYEGFGIPVLEAMQSGCPVVAADIPVLREAGGNAALYADPNSPTDLAMAIQKALEKFPYTTQMMRANVARFSWDDNVAAILAKAESLLVKD